MANGIEDAPELNSYIEVLKFPSSQSDIDHLSISDEEFSSTFDDNVSITNTSIVQLDGVSTRMVTYITSEDIIYRSYLYGVGSTLYRVNFIRKGEVSANDERFFDAIIDSYTIADTDTSDGNASEFLDTMYFVDNSDQNSEGYEPVVTLHQDGTFNFLANLGYAMGLCDGTYSVNGDVYTFNVTSTDFGKNAFEFTMQSVYFTTDWTLIYQSEEILGLTSQGAIFSSTPTLPISISNNEQMKTDSENITIPSNYEDAYNIAQTWINAHPESGITISDYPNYTYKHQGEGVEYYLFYLGDEMYYANLLVNSETGALSMLINYDGEHPYSEITPIDDYYN